MYKNRNKSKIFDEFINILMNHGEITVRELEKRTQIPRSTISRILNTKTNNDILEHKRTIINSCMRKRINNI